MNLLTLIPLVTLCPLILISCIYFQALYSSPKDPNPQKYTPTLSLFMCHLLILFMTLSISGFNIIFYILLALLLILNPLIIFFYEEYEEDSFAKKFLSVLIQYVAIVVIVLILYFTLENPIQLVIQLGQWIVFVFAGVGMVNLPISTLLQWVNRPKLRGSKHMKANKETLKKNI